MRLVDKSEVEELMKYYGFHAPDMTITEFIEDELTTISAVPVVRCRECKSYDHGCCVVKRYRGDDSIITMPPDGYCSYGQRKEAAHD